LIVVPAERITHMSGSYPKAFSLWLAASACLLAVPALAEPIQWVTVGDPGNTADDTTYGDVLTSFQIMKYEFTNQQYTDFLNSVDAGGINPNSVYNVNMGNDIRGGISFTSGAASGSKYAVKSNMGDKPVNYVSWFDAARVANWYQNGATSLSSTETGAYTLDGATTGNAPAVNPGATFYIPTEDQWYKAAYYMGGGTTAGYWDYATQSDTAPTAVTADTTGIGSAGSTGNFANYLDDANWNDRGGNVTTVGTNGVSSAYGAFDMNGNITEWNDLTGLVAGSTRGVRGGFWGSFSESSLRSSFNQEIAPSDESDVYGFRLASVVAVPEPSTWVMAAGGLACAGWGAWRRNARRSRLPLRMLRSRSEGAS
jgi:formylglycine-generating enzyme required for sulfatase activity